MAIHLEILDAARRLCAERDQPDFSPQDIVAALPHLNPRSVRTHVTSRCCVNAPEHHQSRLAYFRKIRRGRYELLAGHRPPRRRAGKRPRPAAANAGPHRDTIHAVVTRDGATYIADCLEVAVVTQGRTLDETLANLSEAVGLHLEGEDLAALGLSGVRRIQVTLEIPAAIDAA